MVIAASVLVANPFLSGWWHSLHEIANWQIFYRPKVAQLKADSQIFWPNQSIFLGWKIYFPLYSYFLKRNL